MLNISLIVIVLIHFIINLTLTFLTKKKINLLKYLLIASYDSPILSILLSTIYVSTGSLKDVISIYREYKKEINDELPCQIQRNNQNVYLKKSPIEIFNDNFLQPNFQKIIVNPNIILTNFNDFIKSIEIISTFEESYLNELDDKVSLIAFAYFFLPFITTQIYFLLSNNEILLFWGISSQLFLLIYIYIFINKKIIELNKIRGTLYG